VLTLSELDARLRTHSVERYYREPHSETGVPPQVRWEADGFLPRLPESLEQLDLLLLTVAKPRRVHQNGIHFQGFRYIDTTLAAYVGEAVTIRYDPRDMRVRTSSSSFREFCTVGTLAGLTPGALRKRGASAQLWRVPERLADQVARVAVTRNERGRPGTSRGATGHGHRPAPAPSSPGCLT